MSTSQPAVEEESGHLSHATPSIPTKPPSRRNSFIGTIGNGGGAPKSPTHRHSRTNSPREASGTEVILSTSDGAASDSAQHQVRRGAAAGGETTSSSAHAHSSNENASGSVGGLGLPSASSSYTSPLVLVDLSKASPAEPLVGGAASLSQSQRINSDNNTNTNATLSSAPSMTTNITNTARDASLANDTNADKLLVAQSIGQKGSDAVRMPTATLRSSEGGLRAQDWQTAAPTTIATTNNNNTASGNAAANVSSSSKRRGGGAEEGGASPTPATPPSTPISTSMNPSATVNPTTINAVASRHTHPNSTELSPIPAAQPSSSGGANAGTGTVTARPPRLQGGVGPAAPVPSVRPPLSSISGLERVAAIPKLQGSSDRMKERVGTCVHNLMAAKCPERLHTYAEVMRLYEGKEEVLLDALQTVFGDEHFYGGGGIKLGGGGTRSGVNNQQEIVNRLLSGNPGYAGGRGEDLLGGGATSMTSFHASVPRRRSQSPNTTATLFTESAKGIDTPSAVNTIPCNNNDISERSHNAFAQRMGVGTVVEQHQHQHQYRSSSSLAAMSTVAAGHALPSASIAVAAHTSTFSRTGAILTPPLPRELMIGVGAGTIAMQQQRASSGLNPTNPTNKYQYAGTEGVRAGASVSRSSSYRGF